MSLNKLPILLSLSCYLALPFALTAESTTRRHAYFLQSKPTDCQIGLEFTTSGLYWKAYVPNQWYAVSVPELPPAFNSSANWLGDLKEPTYQGAFGFRAGTAYNFTKQPFGLHLDFTYFHDTGSSSAMQNPFSTDSLTATDAPFLIQEGSSNLKLRYHVWDLYALYSVLRENHYAVNLQFGAIGAWIAQNNTVLYFAPTQPSYVNYDIQTKWRYAAGGPKIGVNAEYRIIANFGIHAGANFAATVGSYQLTFKRTTPPLSPADYANVTGNINFSERKWIYSLQAVAGLAYTLALDCFSLDFYADYEANIWFDLHQQVIGRATQLTSSRILTLNNENLSTQGVTFGLKWKF